MSSSIKKISIIALVLLSAPATAFAAAGFADRFFEHQRWIYPAYAYCLVFGLICLTGLFFLTLIRKTGTRKVTERISAYLRERPVPAILFCGILWAIPVGITVSVTWEIFWLWSMYPELVLEIAFPVLLVVKRFRESTLLSPACIKWVIVISASAIIASLLFIVLTECGLLPGTDGTFLPYVRRPRIATLQTHPFGSLKDIWGTVLAFLLLTVISLLCHSMGLLSRLLARTLSRLRNRPTLPANPN